ARDKERQYIEHIERRNGAVTVAIADVPNRALPEAARNQSDRLAACVVRHLQRDVFPTLAQRLDARQRDFRKAAQLIAHFFFSTILLTSTTWFTDASNHIPSTVARSFSYCLNNRSAALSPTSRAMP